MVWNLRQFAPAARLGMDAIWHDTPTASGPWVPPGIYTLRLTVDGVVQEKALDVRPDPRK